MMKFFSKDIRSLRKGLAVAAVAMAGLLAVPASYAMPSESEAPQVEMTVQPTVKVLNGHVEIYLPGDEARQVAIYALTGQLVKSLTVQPGVSVIELPAGYYIVKCDRLSQRVIVR